MLYLLFDFTGVVQWATERVSVAIFSKRKLTVCFWFAYSCGVGHEPFSSLVCDWWAIGVVGYGPAGRRANYSCGGWRLLAVGGTPRAADAHSDPDADGYHGAN